MKFADIFTSGAVLQCRKPIAVWGEDFDGSRIRVTMGTVSEETLVVDGKWSVKLPPFEPGQGMILTAENDLGECISLSDIAIGEVWIAGGQSNMEFLMKHDAERETVLASVNNALIRFYECPKISYEGQLQDEDHSHEGLWRKAIPGESGWISAVGFYFAEKLQQGMQGIPVGIIGCNWGGTSASCWMTDDYLDGELSFYPEMREKTRMLDLEKEFAEYKKTRAMQNTPQARAGMDMFLATPLLQPFQMTFSEEELKNFLRTKYAPYSPFAPGALFTNMLHRIIPYTAAGVIWYQGEEDAAFPETYSTLLTQMIRCWRDNWQDELPFIIAQLTAYTNPGGGQKLDFAPIREAQEYVSKSVPFTYLVCTMDAGMEYDIHPKNKRPVGERMALQALNHVYGFPVLSDSPEVSSVYKEKGKAVLTLRNCGEGLVVKGECVQSLVLTVNGIMAEADVLVSGDTITVCSDAISELSRIHIAYEQKDYCLANVFSSAGLPVLPFIVRL